MNSVLQDSIKQAFRDKRPITDCAIQLLKNLVASRKYAELVDILARAEKQITNRAIKSDNRPPSQGASSHWPHTAVGGSAGSRTAAQTLSFTTALSLARKPVSSPISLPKRSEPRCRSLALNFATQLPTLSD
jgi:hypothetical protein